MVERRVTNGYTGVQNVITKYIYFPTGQETGMQEGIPEIIYVFETLERDGAYYIKAARTAEQAARGSGVFLLRNRAAYYTNALWNDCLDYMKSRRSNEGRYQEIFENRRNYEDD